jgi:hypothetical protein
MSRRSRPSSVLVALLVACLFAAIGFRVGQIVRPSPAAAASTWQSAAALSFAHARGAAYRRAWRQGYAVGWRTGTAAADAAGSRAGRAAGRAEAAMRADAARALAAVLASSPRKLRPGTKTEACVAITGGLCEVLGPRVTGRPCPPSSVVYPEGGAVCIPRVLLLAAREG